MVDVSPRKDVGHLSAQFDLVAANDCAAQTLVLPDSLNVHAFSGFSPCCADPQE
jgi:hypothetical protein